MANKKRTLLVEGENDAQVLLNLLGANNISAEFRGYKTQEFDNSQSITIRKKGGVDNLLMTLETEINANEDFLGIVVDADSSLDSRWQSLMDRLKDEEIGYSNTPAKPMRDGTILESEGFLPKLGVWIMPNNELVGKIEDFIRLLVAEEQENLWQFAEKVVTEIPEKDKLFAKKDNIKAQIHTFLAWQEEPGRPMGESITRRYFQVDAPEALKFVEWIRALFELI